MQNSPQRETHGPNPDATDFPDPQSTPVDVTEIMRGIQARAREKRRAVIADEMPPPDMPEPALDELHRSVAELRKCRESLDRLPPQPPTLRGFIGAALARMVRRALFWQYTKAESFQSAVAHYVEQTPGLFQTVFSRIASISETGQRSQRTVQEQLSIAEDRIATLKAEIRQLNSSSEMRIGELSAAYEQLKSSSEMRIGELSAAYEQLKSLGEMRIAELAGLYAQVMDAAARIESDTARLTANGESLRAQLSSLDRYAIHTRQNLVLQEQRLSLTLSELRRTNATPRTTDGSLSSADSMAGLYMAFEDAFRGPQEDITERVSVYLADLRDAGLQPGSDSVVDIGCGRGEWLTVLGRAGYRVRGCDSNQTMVGACQERGLDVAHEDAIQFLASIPENSVGAITAFHVVEHLPIASALALIDGCLRVLRPGGLLILETPNPVNVLVSCHTFHFDPTHVRPLPMQLLQFLVEARGFCGARVKWLHPYPVSMLLPEDSECAQRFNQYFYGPQDYAILATKL